MLRFLSVRNLAVIDRLEIEFEPGLNVLTGETGAGKSILVGAVGLLVGGRASADLVRTGEETARQSTVRSRRALRFEICARLSLICTVSTITSCSSIPPHILTCSTRSQKLTPSDPRWLRRSLVSRKSGQNVNAC